MATNATHDTETTADWYDALSREERERLEESRGSASSIPRRHSIDARAIC